MSKHVFIKLNNKYDWGIVMSDEAKEKSEGWVDQWLEKETEHTQTALENASKYFDDNDDLTVNTIEAVYGKESSFGAMQKNRGIEEAAGHFQLRKPTAEEYGLIVSKGNDTRFDIDYASSAAARYLKDIDNAFSKKTTLIKGRDTIPVKDPSERKKFVLGAYNTGQGRVARAQYLAEQAEKNPTIWDDVKEFLEAAGDSKEKADEARDYVEKVLVFENEFAKKSLANKKAKAKEGKSVTCRCSSGHWVTIDDRPVFICD